MQPERSHLAGGERELQPEEKDDQPEIQSRARQTSLSLRQAAGGERPEPYVREEHVYDGESGRAMAGVIFPKGEKLC